MTELTLKYFEYDVFGRQQGPFQGGGGGGGEGVPALKLEKICFYDFLA